MDLYQELEKSIRQHKSRLFVGQNRPENDIRYAVRWVMRDNPE